MWSKSVCGQMCFSESFCGLVLAEMDKRASGGCGRVYSGSNTIRRSYIVDNSTSNNVRLERKAGERMRYNNWATTTLSQSDKVVGTSLLFASQNGIVG